MFYLRNLVMSCPFRFPFQASHWPCQCKYSRTMMEHFNFMGARALPEWGGRALGQGLLLDLGLASGSSSGSSASAAAGFATAGFGASSSGSSSSGSSSASAAAGFAGFGASPSASSSGSSSSAAAGFAITGFVMLGLSSSECGANHPTGCGAPRAAFGNQRCAAPMPYPHGHACLAVPSFISPHGSELQRCGWHTHRGLVVKLEITSQFFPKTGETYTHASHIVKQGLLQCPSSHLKFSTKAISEFSPGSFVSLRSFR